MCASAGMYATADAIPPYPYLWLDGVQNGKDAQARVRRTVLRRRCRRPSSPCTRTRRCAIRPARSRRCCSSDTSTIAAVDGARILELRETPGAMSCPGRRTFAARHKVRSQLVLRPEARMALTTQTMTDEQRKSVAIEYLKAFDNGGVTSERRQHPLAVRRGRPGLLPEVGARQRQGRDRQVFRRRRRDVEGHHPPLLALQLDLLGQRHHRRRGHQPRRTPGRSVARRFARVRRRPLVRRLRDPRLEDPARASSTSIPTTPARTPPATPGCRKSAESVATRVGQQVVSEYESECQLA